MKYSDGFAIIESKVASVRKIEFPIKAPDIDDSKCLRNRATLIFVLEYVLEQHRMRFSTIFEPLKGIKALHHLIFTKTNWNPIEIRELSLADCLFVIQDELLIEKLPEDAKEYIKHPDMKLTNRTFPQVLNEEWEPRESSLFQ